KLVRMAQLKRVSLRQSYARVRKYALIQHQRYAHASSSSAPTGRSRRCGPISAA
ncbi:hypothetical protein ABMB68_009455, partial [Bradyrhizobium sp. RT4a]